MNEGFSSIAGKVEGAVASTAISAAAKEGTAAASRAVANAGEVVSGVVDKEAGLLQKAGEAIKRVWVPVSAAITNSKVGQALAKIGGPVLTKIVGLVAPSAAVPALASTVAGGVLVAGAGFLAYKGVKFALKHRSLKQQERVAAESYSN